MAMIKVALALLLMVTVTTSSPHYPAPKTTTLPPPPPTPPKPKHMRPIWIDDWWSHKELRRKTFDDPVVDETNTDSPERKCPQNIYLTNRLLCYSKTRYFNYEESSVPLPEERLRLYQQARDRVRPRVVGNAVLYNRN